MEINKRVLLLALYKRAANESCKDVVLMLEASHLFSLKEGKRLLRQLRDEEFLAGELLTPKGVALAKRIEEEFRL